MCSKPKTCFLFESKLHSEPEPELESENFLEDSLTSLDDLGDSIDNRAQGFELFFETDLNSLFSSFTETEFMSQLCDEVSTTHAKNNNKKKKKLERASMAIFMNFVDYNQDHSVSAHRILSKKCYEAWIGSRKRVLKHPGEAFRKTVTSHVRGSDGRRPFPPIVENALLAALRQPRIWNCFEGTELKVGERGCSVKGFWESQQPTPPSSPRKRKLEDQDATKFPSSLQTNSEPTLKRSATSSTSCLPVISTAVAEEKVANDILGAEDPLFCWYEAMSQLDYVG